MKFWRMMDRLIFAVARSVVYCNSKFNYCLVIGVCYPLEILSHRNAQFSSLPCTIRGLLRHVHGEPWPMSQLYFVLAVLLLEPCQTPM